MNDVPSCRSTRRSGRCNCPDDAPAAPPLRLLEDTPTSLRLLGTAHLAGSSTGHHFALTVRALFQDGLAWSLRAEADFAHWLDCDGAISGVHEGELGLILWRSAEGLQLRVTPALDVDRSPKRSASASSRMTIAPCSSNSASSGTWA